MRSSLYYIHMNRTEIKWETVLCTEKNTTKQAGAQQTCRRQLIKPSVGQRNADSQREKGGGAHNLSKKRHKTPFLLDQEEREEMATWL